MKKTLKKPKKSPFVLASKYKAKKQDNIQEPKYEPNFFETEFLKEYKIQKLLKFQIYGVRPKRLRIDKLMEIIEEIYDQRFESEMNYIRKTFNQFSETNINPPGNLYEFVYEFYQLKYKNNIKVIEQKILELIASIEQYKNKERSINLFFKFFNKFYNKMDLNCFLLMRVLIIQVIKKKNEKTKLSLPKWNLNNLIVNIEQGKEYAQTMFKQCDFLDSNVLIKIIFQNKEQMIAYEFLHMAVEIYKQVREKKNQFNQEKINIEQQEQQIQNDLEDEINEKYFENLKQNEKKSNKIENFEIIQQEMKNLVYKFVESLENEDENLTFSNIEQLKEVKEIIVSKMENLLQVVYENDKANWYKEICVEKPQEKQEFFRLQIFSQLNFLLKEGNKNDIQQFCKKIFKIPEISQQISDYLSYILDPNFESDQEISEYDNDQLNQQKIIFNIQMFNCIDIFKPNDGFGGLYLGDLVTANNTHKLENLQINSIIALCKINHLEYKPYTYFKLDRKKIQKYYQGQIESSLYQNREIALEKYQGVINYFEKEQIGNKIKVVAIDDLDSQDISRYFIECAKFIHQKRKLGLNVLVHCYKGNSRAPTIIIAYLLYYYHSETFLQNNGEILQIEIEQFKRESLKDYNKPYFEDLDEIFEFMEKQHKYISINSGFMSQLQELEKFLCIKFD